MVEDSGKAPRSGGVFVGLGPIAGAFAGGMLGQPTIGLLAGLALGAGIAVLIWLADRKR